MYVLSVAASTFSGVVCTGTTLLFTRSSSVKAVVDGGERGSMSMTKKKEKHLLQMQVEAGALKGFSPQIAKQTEPGSDMHHFYLNGMIKGADHYVELIHTLRGCSPNDYVFIHINSPGGHLFTVTQIVHAIQDCPGTVITCAEGMAYSGGSIIFLAGHQMVVGEFASFMAHDIQTIDAGSLYDVEVGAAHIRSLYDRLCERVYSPFLPKKEMRDIRTGGSVYLDAAELTRRLMKVAKKASKK